MAQLVTVLYESNNDDYRLVSFNPDDGTVNWESTITSTDFVFRTATVVNGSGYVATDYGKVVKYDVTSQGSKQWETEHSSGSGNGLESVTVLDGTVYAATDGGEVWTIDADTGNDGWYSDFQTNGFNAAPHVVDGSVYVVNNNGFFSVNAGDGAEEWFYSSSQTGRRTKPQYWSPGNDVIFGQEKDIISIDADSGSHNWTFTVDNIDLYGTPTIRDDTIFAVDPDGYVYSINASDGSENWQKQVQGTSATQHSPIYYKDKVIVEDNEFPQNIEAKYRDDGSTAWTKEVNYYNQATGTVKEDIYYYFDGGNKIWAINTDNGNVVWSKSHSRFNNVSEQGSSIVYVENGDGIGNRTGQKCHGHTGYDWVAGEKIIGNIGDDTPFWRSEYVYGDDDMPILLYNEGYEAT